MSIMGRARIRFPVLNSPKQKGPCRSRGLFVIELNSPPALQWAGCFALIFLDTANGRNRILLHFQQVDTGR